VPRVRSTSRRSRSLYEVALENATEGCVREAYGALFAVWQSQHASDPRLRSAMKDIARDEAEHAELARDVHRWARARLNRRERASLERAMQNAWVDLEREVGLARPSMCLTSDLGVPAAHIAAVLVRELRLSC